MFTANDLSTLAAAFCSATGKSFAALGTEITGSHKFFKLLRDGRGAHSRNIERASLWFLRNWPADAPWPQGVRDLRSPAVDAA